MISLLFACLFAHSLLPGRKPLCLRFAERISGGIVPDGAEPYCRRLTWVWLFVLLGNASAGAAIMSAGAIGIWRIPLSVVVSTIAVCGTFAIEKLIRNRRFSVAFSTSGSTSAPKHIVKTFESLAKEVAFHRERLADVLAQKPLFISTVEPQHMYGTLWRVMLPKAAGCEADPEVILTPESLIEKMRVAKKVFLVTTPSFLERFAAYADLYDVPQNCIEITTSGALLTAEVSAAARRVFGIVPLEIFGSTETGGVACRRQTTPDCDWTLFAPVKARTDKSGRLTVESPFSVTRPFTMGDGAAFAADGRTFKLHGRLDRLVKIAEQRVLLPELEDAMRRLPDVKDAALCPLEGPHGTYLGAVVVLETSEAPVSLLHKRSLDLRQNLLPIFPKGSVPKKYRFVHELPRNAQGKVLDSSVREILMSGMCEPLVENVVRSADAWSADLTFPVDAPYFKGHFPNFPLLPGVVQLGMAHRFAEMFLRQPFQLGTVKKIKFSMPIRPGDHVRFSLQRRSADEIAYSYAKEGISCSSGIICRAPDAGHSAVSAETPPPRAL